MVLTRSRPLPVTAEVKKMGRTLLRGEKKRVLVPVRVLETVETTRVPKVLSLSLFQALLIDLLAHDVLSDADDVVFVLHEHWHALAGRSLDGAQHL